MKEDFDKLNDVIFDLRNGTSYPRMFSGIKLDDLPACQKICADGVDKFFKSESQN